MKEGLRITWGYECKAEWLHNFVPITRRLLSQGRVSMDIAAEITVKSVPIHSASKRRNAGLVHIRVTLTIRRPEQQSEGLGTASGFSLVFFEGIEVQGEYSGKVLEVRTRAAEPFYNHYESRNL